MGTRLFFRKCDMKIDVSTKCGRFSMTSAALPRSLLLCIISNNVVKITLLYRSEGVANNLKQIPAILIVIIGKEECCGCSQSR